MTLSAVRITGRGSSSVSSATSAATRTTSSANAGWEPSVPHGCLLGRAASAHGGPAAMRTASGWA
eukprot:6823142-Alexandrium_andersonii.AAC.1